MHTATHMDTCAHKHTHMEGIWYTITLGVTPLLLIVTELLLVSDPITRSLSFHIWHLHFFFVLVLSISLFSLFVFFSYEFFRLFVVDFVVNPPFDLPPVLPFFLSSVPPSIPPSIHLSSLSPALTDVLMSPLPSPSIIHHFFYSTIPIVS